MPPAASLRTVGVVVRLRSSCPGVCLIVTHFLQRFRRVAPVGCTCVVVFQYVSPVAVIQLSVFFARGTVTAGVTYQLCKTTTRLPEVRMSIRWLIMVIPAVAYIFTPDMSVSGQDTEPPIRSLHQQEIIKRWIPESSYGSTDPSTPAGLRQRMVRRWGGTREQEPPSSSFRRLGFQPRTRTNRPSRTLPAPIGSIAPSTTASGGPDRASAAAVTAPVVPAGSAATPRAAASHAVHARGMFSGVTRKRSPTGRGALPRFQPSRRPVSSYSASRNSVRFGFGARR